MTRFASNQGVINGRITALVNKPEELKEFMKDKTEKQQRLGRSHYWTVKGLRCKFSAKQ